MMICIELYEPGPALHCVLSYWIKSIIMTKKKAYGSKAKLIWGLLKDSVKHQFYGAVSRDFFEEVLSHNEK